MASSFSKLAKLEEQVEKARQDAAAEAAALALDTGAYELGEKLLKRLLQVAARATPEQVEAGIKKMSEPVAAAPGESGE